MSNIAKHIELFKKHRVSTIVRTTDFDHAYNIIKGSYLGGIKFIEITLTCPNPYELIKKIVKDFPELEVGAGTVMTLKEAQDSIKAGATYLVSPIADTELVKWSKKNDILCIAGGVTPTEMYALKQAGAELIKFFPATISGYEYIKFVKNPFPEIEVLATGGIDLSNIDKFIEAGVVGCGVTAELGGAPIGTSIEKITETAKEYVNKVKKFI